MLFKRAVLEKIANGEVDRAFRRWKRPTVKTGGRLRTAIGELAIVDVATVAFADLTETDARLAGYPDLTALAGDLSQDADRDIYRILLRIAGTDAREALRNDDALTHAQCVDIIGRLSRFDARMPVERLSASVLAWIEIWPDRRAQDMADEIGIDKAKLKAHIRKLKELGLTESRQVGYRLSPRGQRVLEAFRSEDST
ncbi:MAG: hypothetical protein AAGG56_11490 [Pseudomonadota bacterium]